MWLRNARLVLPDQMLERGSIRIEGGRIAEISLSEGPRRPSDESFDASGLTVLPGIIDFHGDMLERDMEPRPGVFFPTDLALIELDKRLAATGVTTAYAAVSFMDSAGASDTRTVHRARAIVELINAHRDTLMVDMLVHARYEVTSPLTTPTLLELIETDQVHLVSLMDHTPGQGQYRDVAKYAEIIEAWRKVSRQEADQMAQARARKTDENGIDWDLVRLVAETATSRGLRVASHDDDTREKVDLMVDLGVHLSEFPVTRVAAERTREVGLHVAMGAPNLFLGGSHNGNLSARDAIAAGLVDILVADYYPAALLHSVFELARSGMMPLDQGWKLVSENPAHALGLTDRGKIEPGRAADLILVEDAPRPRVRGTLRNGVPIYWDGCLGKRTAPNSPPSHKELGEP